MNPDQDQSAQSESKKKQAVVRYAQNSQTPSKVVSESRLETLLKIKSLKEVDPIMNTLGTGNLFVSFYFTSSLLSFLTESVH